MQVRSACLGVHDCSCQNNNVAGAGAYEAYDGKSSPGEYPQELLLGDRTIVESEVPPDGGLMTHTFFCHASSYGGQGHARTQGEIQLSGSGGFGLSNRC